MKKKYLKPEIEVVTIPHIQLMTSSPEVGTTETPIDETTISEFEELI